MQNGSGYLLYMIIDDLFEAGFPMSDDLNRQVTELEKEVFAQDYSRDN